jgi:hypothetical protein
VNSWWKNRPNDPLKCLHILRPFPYSFGSRRTPVVSLPLSVPFFPYFAYISTLKMEAAHSSKMAVHIYQNTQPRNPEYNIVYTSFVNKRNVLMKTNILYLKSTIFWDITPKRRLTLNRLHGVISQKMIPFIITPVKTSNSIYYTWTICSEKGMESFEWNFTR